VRGVEIVFLVTLKNVAAEMEEENEKDGISGKDGTNGKDGTKERGAMDAANGDGINVRSGRQHQPENHVSGEKLREKSYLLVQEQWLNAQLAFISAKEKPRHLIEMVS
jgi:hypothetical protein